MTDALAYIGIGANLSAPEQQVEAALQALAVLATSRLVAVSPRYRTVPVGPVAQPDFINAVACLETRLDPGALLQALQQIELAQGRVRDGPCWGPRTLDLDLLLYNDLCLQAPGLQLPHPHLHQRAFVLIPLAAIAAPDLHIPGRGRLGDLLAAVGTDGVTRID
ncbi:MAG: 2-amino-4-hydroxy-6-hydroxymethyldihydropteridine diphosphokinase [Chromatiaceae bacterium]|nr:MAG: 2-amino-4-hydroxy-6-hydroxymethyldihydropteridine diphosphokinase [Chromatiaceae bacterium]